LLAAVLEHPRRRRAFRFDRLTEAFGPSRNIDGRLGRNQPLLGDRREHARHCPGISGSRSSRDHTQRSPDRERTVACAADR
jgi:hypothetical protein